MSEIKRPKDHFIKGAKLEVNSAISDLQDAIGLINVGFYDAAAREIACATKKLSKAVEHIAMLPPREIKQ